MFSNAALDVVIGLVFVYLLYSLLVTIVQEIIANKRDFRSKFLEKAIIAMLEDNKALVKSRLVTWGMRIKEKKDGGLFSRSFYAHPLIKYFGRQPGKSKPSYIEGSTFAKVMIDLLRGSDADAGQDTRNKIQTSLDSGWIKWMATAEVLNKDKEDFAKPKPDSKAGAVMASLAAIDKLCEDTRSYLDKAGADTPELIALLNQWLASAKNARSKAWPVDTDKISEEASVLITALENNTQDLAVVKDQLNKWLEMAEKLKLAFSLTHSDRICKDTQAYLKSLWTDAQGDVEKFKALLENWFDEMMDRTTGWYKKYIQYISFLIGLGIAFIFNVDTIRIATKLQKDPALRAQVVQMADAYVKAHPDLGKEQEQEKAKMKEALDKDASLTPAQRELKTKANAADIDTAYNRYKKTQDSLVKQANDLMQKDISKVNGLLGLGFLSIEWAPHIKCEDGKNCADCKDSAKCKECIKCNACRKAALVQNKTAAANDTTAGKAKADTITGKDKTVAVAAKDTTAGKNKTTTIAGKDKTVAAKETTTSRAAAAAGKDQRNTTSSKDDKAEVEHCTACHCSNAYDVPWGKDFLILCRSILGWLITALALSLGAPFWFDMLNKLIQLRSSVAPKDDKTAKSGPTEKKPNTVG